MGLIAWCPLIGDTIKSNLNNSLTISSSTLTSGVGGKLGEGFTFDGSSNYIDINNIQLSSEMSFAVWFNMSTAKACFIMDARSSSGVGYQPMYYSPESGIQIYSTTSPSGGFINTGTLKVGTWYHLVVTMQNGNTSLYLNGEHIATRTLGASTNASMVTIGSRYSHTASTMFNGILQDVRIYDHALSVAEIKELSKGLIFHYSFNDRYSEGTTNLVSSLKAGGRTTVNNTTGIVTTAGLDQDTYFYLVLSEALVSGETYTIQCIGENIPEGEYWTFGMSGQTATDPKFNIYNGYNEFTFVATDKNAASTSVLFDDTRRTNVWSSQCQFSKFQIEKKDHATPYVKSSRPFTNYPDESGNGHNGSQTDISYTTNSASGSLSAKFNGTTSGIQVPFIKPDLMTSDYTIAFWIYPNETQRDTIWGDYNTTGGSQVNFERYSSSPYALRIYYGADRNSSYNVASAGIPTGEWSHMAVTYNQTTNTFTVYKNGVKAYSFVYNVSAYTKTSGIFWIGRDSRATAPQNLNGNIADFRFYATTLSDNDILNLYSSKAQISDMGDFLVGEFIENQNELQVKENYVFECNELIEEISSEYDRVEHISSTGSQYVDTGYIPQTNDITIELDMEWIGTSTGTFETFAGFMFSTTQNNPRAGIHYYSNNFMFGANATTLSSVAPIKNERTIIKGHFKSGQQTLYKDGVQIASNTTTFNFTSNTCPIYIFARYCPNSMNYAKMKLYSAKIYEKDTIVRNFIPSRRKSDGVVGIYDIIQGAFYPNNGSGTFAVGGISTNNDVAFYENNDVSSRNLMEI